jgi:hypothetical protein
MSNVFQSVPIPGDEHGPMELRGFCEEFWIRATLACCSGKEVGLVSISLVFVQVQAEHCSNEFCYLLRHPLRRSSPGRDDD